MRRPWPTWGLSRQKQPTLQQLRPAQYNFMFKLTSYGPFTDHNQTCIPESRKETIKMVKSTVVQAPRLCTGCTAHRGSRSIALLFHDHGTRRGWGVSVTRWMLFTPEKDPVPVVQEVGWVPQSHWTGAENLAPTGIRSSDRPVRIQELYGLCYPAHTYTGTW